MTDLKTLLADVQVLRDKAQVKINLGSKELQSEWHALETKWAKFSQEAELKKSGQEVSAALGLLGNELKSAYERISKVL